MFSCLFLIYKVYIYELSIRIHNEEKTNVYNLVRAYDMYINKPDVCLTKTKRGKLGPIFARSAYWVRMKYFEKVIKIPRCVIESYGE